MESRETGKENTNDGDDRLEREGECVCVHVCVCACLYLNGPSYLDTQICCFPRSLSALIDREGTCLEPQSSSIPHISHMRERYGVEL